VSRDDSEKTSPIQWCDAEIQRRINANRPEDRPDEKKHVIPAFRRWLNSTTPNNSARTLSLGQRPKYGDHWWIEERETTGLFIIDVVFEEADSVVVTEVETELNNSAVGQALVYAHVYRNKRYNQNYSGKDVIPAVACCIAPSPYLDMARAVGVRVYFCKKGLTKSVKKKSLEPLRVRS